MSIHLSESYPFLFDYHSEAVCILNLHGDIIYANDNAGELFNDNRDLLLNRSYKDVYCFQSSAEFHYYFHQSVRGETHEFQMGMGAEHHRHRSELLIKTVPNILRGEILSVTLYITNMLDQQDVEADILQRSQDLCESFIENNRDPILLLNLDAKIVLANQAFSKLLGWKKENLEGFHILDCPSIPPHLIDQMKQYYTKVVSAVYEQEGEVNDELDTINTIRMTDDGKEYNMMLSITPIFDMNHKICNWAVHLRDITDKKLLEEEVQRLVIEHTLSQELSQLEHFNTVSQISASISHEVRNPLTVTRGFIQLLKNADLSEENREHYIDLSLRELDRASNIITDYLTFAKPSPDNVECLDLNQEIDYIISVINPYATMKNIHIQVSREAESLHILGESKKLHQSFINIIKNGVEAVEDNGNIHITLKKEAKRVIVEIKDTGKGMDEEQVAKLGTPYYTTKDKGTGLGTMVAFGIIKAMQGEVQIESEVGKGTTFYISFPHSSENGTYQ
ncbi:ATP-binding protein [Caldalkalibacillus salinus]|uniref:ATP-binding protein n=1 Tax=Caldalkalibacillus salinus TaxID=2803787 RepID=UPI001921B7C5|nr:ATP-binding protein [Caldalkalibacillus salinus]